MSFTTVLLIFLVIALIVLVMLWLRGDPEVEAPRSQMDMLEEALRERGFRTLVPIVRDFEKFNEARFLQELQRLMITFMQDREFAVDWLMPILKANMHMVMNDSELRLLFDGFLRRNFGYRLKPIHNVTYGLRPEINMHATTEEQDVCFREHNSATLDRGEKVYTPLTDADFEGVEKGK